MMNRDNHSGQVALIMVLVMTVMSAVAVSVASRTTVETRIQEMNIESKEAILTAQAGLEEAISKSSEVSGSLGEGRLFDVTISDMGTTSVISEQINAGETFEVNLSGAVGLTGVKLYWRSAVAGGTPSIFVTDVRDDIYVDYAYDSVGEYGFTRVISGGIVDGNSYTYTTPTPISIAPNSTHMRITVLEDSAFLGIEPIGGTFPPQTTQYRSVADLESGSAAVRYGIEYTESKTNQLPTVFDYALFSGGSIVQ